MSRGTFNLVLLVALLATLGGVWAMRPTPARPNIEFIPEMVRTPRYNAYSENPNFGDGKTLQAPVEGTIARGFPPLHFAATPEDAARAGNTLKSPIQPAKQAQAVERGAVVFARFCQPCHGPQGRGDGLVVSRGYPAPPSLDADNAKNIKDGQIFHIVTYGQKNMPGYARQISREDRWNVIAYVRSLQAGARGQGSGAAAAAIPQGSNGNKWSMARIPNSESRIPITTGGQP